MTRTIWAVTLRGMVHSIHLDLADANAAACELRRTAQRETDISVRPRKPVHPFWRRPVSQEWWREAGA